jgi:hypothetical protein
MGPWEPSSFICRALARRACREVVMTTLSEDQDSLPWATMFDLQYKFAVSTKHRIHSNEVFPVRLPLPVALVASLIKLV